MSRPVTASMLYNFIQCPHRVELDLYGDPARMDPVSPFVELLWERGNEYEREVVEGLKAPFTNVKDAPDGEREFLTLEAMRRGDALIYGGRIRADDLLGEPDLLKRSGAGYVAGDIKSGAGKEGATEEGEGRLKKHYAVQLALYTDLLERLGRSAGRRPFVWDVHGSEVVYDLDAPQGVRNPVTLWSVYRDALSSARDLAAQRRPTLLALAAICKLCHWRSSCIREAEESDDLTQLPELGRARRDAMFRAIPTVRDLAAADLGRFIRGPKTIFRGIGPGMLERFKERAVLRKTSRAAPYFREPVDIPGGGTELFFDIETDPMRDVCYLHGFVERRRDEERYVPFLACVPTPEEEQRAFADAWGYIASRRPCAIYYYSPYEKTAWRRLREKYPEVAAAGEVEELFSSPETVDLYSAVVRPHMVWPTRDHSIKTLAKYLGFAWRDEDPSGASSVEWYHRWVESGDEAIRRRILLYNEDDCVAMRVLLDAIRRLAG